MKRRQASVAAPIDMPDSAVISVLTALESIDVAVLVARLARLTPKTWSVPQIVSTHWRLYQHDAAGGNLVLDTGDFALVPNRVYLIPPRLSFGTRCQSECRQFFVHFELAGFSAIALHDLFPRPIIVPESIAYEASVRRFSEESDFGSGASSALRLAVHYRVKGIVFEALGRAAGMLAPDRLDIYLHRLSALQPVLPALEEIRNRVGEKLSNRELAALCFMSKDYFIRKFHVALGVSPAQYITDRRVALAARRLLHTTDSLEEIAAYAGFRNRFYFTRVFAREMGVPPATYRRTPQP